MVEVLRSKNLATKFQILLEVAANQPNIQQKDIARELNITSQAISEYVKELMKDGWLSSQGRSKYKVTQRGVGWILRMARQLQNYSSFVNKVVDDISISTAIADDNLSGGQQVSLYMKNGLLFASSVVKDKEAKGIAIAEAKKNEDVGISNVEGMIRLKAGKITIGLMLNIQEGGSRNIDIIKLKEEANRARLVGAIGIEPLAALKRVGIKPDYIYGVKEAAMEAAHLGLPFLILCVEEEILTLVQKLEGENLNYEIINLRKEGQLINI